MNSDTQEGPYSGKFLYRIKLLVLIVLMLALIYFVIVVQGSALVESIGRLTIGSIYISVSNWDIPLLISVPCYLALTYILLLRLVDRASEKAVKISSNIAILFAALAIVARPVYGYITSSKMDQNGYTPCWSYSSPSLMSSTVWVKKPGYCVENTGKVRKAMLIWMDSLTDTTADIPVHVVREQAALLLEAWEEEDRERYPHLYQ